MKLDLYVAMKLKEENEDKLSTNDDSSLPIGLETSSVLLTTRNVSTKTSGFNIKSNLENCTIDVPVSFSPFKKHRTEVREKLTADSSLTQNCIEEEDEEFSESSTLFEADCYIKRMY